jgi:glycosyltransferase involved in cell wall biosynthesis
MPDFMVLNFPIEPIERRYSIEWDNWFTAAFHRNNIPYTTFIGPHVAQPAADKFLDPFSTFRWKFAQLQEAARQLRHTNKKRLVVFLHDGWFPGIEMFPYLRDLEGLAIKIVAWWHAGSYDSTDILGIKGCKQWAGGSEYSWFTMCDRILVGSEYHRNKILHSWHWSDSFDAKIVKMGLPIEVGIPYQEKWPARENIVVWPHRISEDKHPEVFEKLSKEPIFKDVRFIRTLDEQRSKEEYHRLLATAKVAVSTASHENFGIGMVEAAMMGCWPVVPDRLAYRETMPVTRRYAYYTELVDLVASGLERDHAYEYPYKDRYDQIKVTDNVCKIIKEIGEAE